jgi:hypothetical protein
MDGDASGGGQRLYVTVAPLPVPVPVDVLVDVAVTGDNDGSIDVEEDGIGDVKGNDACSSIATGRTLRLAIDRDGNNDMESCVCASLLGKQSHTQQFMHVCVCVCECGDI